MRPVVVKLWAKTFDFCRRQAAGHALLERSRLLFGAQIFITDPTYIKLVFSESLSHGKTAPIYRIQIC